MDTDTPRKHNDKPVDQQNAASKKNVKTSDGGPKAPEVVPSPHNPDGPNHCRYEPSPWWFRLLEGAGIVAVIIYTGITWCEWRDSHSNFLVDERAWISVKEVKVITPYSATSEGKIGIRIINSGKTPALRTDLITASFGQTSDAKLHLVTPSVAMAIGPGIGDATLVLDVPPSDPTAKVYLHFVIQYWDIFQKPNDRPHYTLFCGYYSPPAQTPGFFSTADSVGCNAMN
jgi:hypothetical protein